MDETRNPVGGVPFQIQGDGAETRAFCFVDDIVSGVLTMYAHGGHREIYHIGNDEEVTIRDLAGGWARLSVCISTSDQVRPLLAALRGGALISPRCAAWVISPRFPLMKDCTALLRGISSTATTPSPMRLL